MVAFKSVLIIFCFQHSVSWLGDAYNLNLHLSNAFCFGSLYQSNKCYENLRPNCGYSENALDSFN